MFGTSQRHAMRHAFSALLTYMSWRSNVRGAFRLRFEVQRQYRELEDIVQRDGTTAATRTAAAGKRGVLGAPTLMTRFGNTVLTCRLCRQSFSARANHAQACSYHPGEYRLACPRTCRQFTASCSAHYRERWACCDTTDPSPFGVGGCAWRWHVPAEVHPELREQAERAAADARARAEEVEQAEREARGADLALRRRQHQRLLHIEKSLEAGRKVAARGMTLAKGVTPANAVRMGAIGGQKQR